MGTDCQAGGEEHSHLNWTKSNHSGSGGGNCVEVANLTDGGRAVRNSKNPTGTALIFTSAEWTAFTASVRSSQFD